MKGSTSKKARVGRRSPPPNLLEIAISLSSLGGFGGATSPPAASSAPRWTGAPQTSSAWVAVARQVLSGALTAEQGLADRREAAWVQARIVAGIAPALASPPPPKRRLGGRADTPAHPHGAAQELGDLRGGVLMDLSVIGPGLLAIAASLTGVEASCCQWENDPRVQQAAPWCCCAGCRRSGWAGRRLLRLRRQRRPAPRDDPHGHRQPRGRGAT